MPGAPGHYGFPPQGVPGYYMEDHTQDDDDAGLEEDEDEEDVDMEMPLDQQSAEKAMKHMIYTKLFMEGFDSAQASAVDLLFKEVVGCECCHRSLIQSLRIKQY
jgi:hypothetical protein